MKNWFLFPMIDRIDLLKVVWLVVGW